MLFLYRFFCGVLRVEFYGIYPEKVLNLCAKNKITIWSARFANQKICCKITVRDFLKLPQILRKSGIRVHILEKSGFPFFIKKYHRRFGVFLGFILFFSFLYIMSGYIWIIDVEGNTTVKTQTILTACEELGIKTGVRINKITPKSDAQELLLKVDNLAWGSLNIEGCRLTVNVTEVRQKPEDNTVITNLKASADGVITHIDVTSGNCLVKVGDVVKEGDLLVSGIIETENETRFVHSMGEIIAETETAVTLEENLEKVVNHPTGKVKEKSVLEFFGIKIPLYLGGEKGEYKATKTVKTAKLFSQNLPIKVYTKKFTETRKSKVTITYEKAVENLENTLALDYKGIVKQKDFIKTETQVQLNAVVMDKKNIAVSENLIFGIGN